MLTISLSRWFPTRVVPPTGEGPGTTQLLDPWSVGQTWEVVAGEPLTLPPARLRLTTTQVGWPKERPNLENTLNQKFDPFPLPNFLPILED